MLLQLLVALSAVVGVLGQASEVFVYGDSPESQQVGRLALQLPQLGCIIWLSVRYCTVCTRAATHCCSHHTWCAHAAGACRHAMDVW
jgi:hypothetical protein